MAMKRRIVALSWLVGAMLGGCPQQPTDYTSEETAFQATPAQRIGPAEQVSLNAHEERYPLAVRSFGVSQDGRSAAFIASDYYDEIAAVRGIEDETTQRIEFDRNGDGLYEIAISADGNWVAISSGTTPFP